MTAVSYTHLDVYKRQELGRVVRQRIVEFGDERIHLGYELDQSFGDEYYTVICLLYTSRCV